jgi:hypothetical protein
MNKSGFLLRQRSAIKTWTSSFFEIDPVSHSLRQYDAGRPATGTLSSAADAGLIRHEHKTERRFLTMFARRKTKHVNNDGLSSPFSFFNDLIIASCIVPCCFATPTPAEERAAPTAVVDLVNAAAVTTDDLGAYGEQGRMLDVVFERENCFQVRSSGGDQTVRGRSSRFVSSFR